MTPRSPSTVALSSCQVAMSRVFVTLERRLRESSALFWKKSSDALDLLPPPPLLPCRDSVGVRRLSASRNFIPWSVVTVVVDLGVEDAEEEEELWEKDFWNNFDVLDLLGEVPADFEGAKLEAEISGGLSPFTCCRISFSSGLSETCARRFCFDSKRFCPRVRRLLTSPAEFIRSLVLTEFDLLSAAAAVGVDEAEACGWDLESSGIQLSPPSYSSPTESSWHCSRESDVLEWFRIILDSVNRKKRIG